MSEPPDLVVIAPDGAVRVAGRAAERRLRDRHGRYRLVADAPGLIVLRTDDDTNKIRVAMAGELVTRTSALEVLNIIANANWRGDLHLFDERHHRLLSIDRAALKHAWSDHPDDRLGQVLYRNGVLSRSQLDELLRQVGPERRLGQLLLEQQILTQEQLFQHLQKQVEQIFFSSLLIRSGQYAFVVSEEDLDPPHHTVHLPVQALLMEGVQRIDEMALFRDQIPSDDLVPEPQPKAASCTLDETAQLVLAYADGQRTLEEISRETGLGQFMTSKAVYGMLQQGAMILRPKKVFDAEAVKKLVRAFNEVLRDIFMAVATYGGVDQTRATLEAWIHGSGYAGYFGDQIQEDGALSMDTVVEAMRGVHVDNPLGALHQALHEMAAFTLFAATTTLPRDQELSLSRDVNARLKRIRIQ